MENKEDLVALSFKVPRDLHAELKIEAIRHRKTLSEYVMEMIRKEIGNGHGDSSTNEG